MRNLRKIINSYNSDEYEREQDRYYRSIHENELPSRKYERADELRYKDFGWELNGSKKRNRRNANV